MRIVGCTKVLGLRDLESKAMPRVPGFPGLGLRDLELRGVDCSKPQTLK